VIAKMKRREFIIALRGRGGGMAARGAGTRCSAAALWLLDCPSWPFSSRRSVFGQSTHARARPLSLRCL
jgi:hypothetical protein